MAPQPKNIAPKGPVTKKLQMDTSGYPASALSEALINKALAATKVFLTPGVDCDVDDLGMVSPLFTNPSPEKIAEGKAPFPYITFTSEEGQVYRVYGRTAKDVVDVPTWTVEGDMLVAGLSVTADGVVAEVAELV